MYNYYCLSSKLRNWLVFVLCMALVVITACSASPTPDATFTPQPEVTATLALSLVPTSLPSATPLPEALTIESLEHLLSQVSQDTLFAFLEDLTAIQPYSGWRTSATTGEVEAIDYVARQITAMDYLQSLGVTLEKQSYRVYNSTELWETRLQVVVAGQEIEIPADGIRGSRSDNDLALRFDSDGVINDTEHNPVVVEGPVTLFRSRDEIIELTSEDVAGRLVFIDYALIDQFALAPHARNEPTASDVLALNPAAIVLVTQFSNISGESHGTFVGDANAFTKIAIAAETPAVPILYTCIEDMAVAGIETWDDFAKIEAARLTWDADVFSPGTSGNIVAHIPGQDSSRAVILGAHIDSPNSPGAMDDGSGSVALLEVARVLNTSQIQPPVDLVLTWFGSEEIGLCGSSHFVATHQELLDRTLGFLQIDMLSYPLEGMEFHIDLNTWGYKDFDHEQIPWINYIAQLAQEHGITVNAEAIHEIQSDNIAFAGFNVPNANMIYKGPATTRYTHLHYPAHIHDPYDTVELARKMGDELVQMTQVALLAALGTGTAPDDFYVPPTPMHRALFVASHTEALLMSPMSFTAFGQALAMDGFDVDMIPYGQPVTAEDLQSADLVIMLPVVDLPGRGSDMTLYDEAWTEAEMVALEEYVAGGGMLVITNSSNRLTLVNGVLDPNEDWVDVNDFSERLGIHYQYNTLDQNMIWVVKESHPLVEGLSYVEQIPNNSIPFTMEEGLALATQNGRAVIGLVNYGSAGGEVLVLSDVGLLGNNGMGIPDNLRLWQNLAHYAAAR